MWHVTPEFVIELRSASDCVKNLRAKMREWTANGAVLAWLIVPETRSVEIYRANGSVEEVNGTSEIRGEGPVEGFVMKLNRIWQGIQA